MGRTKTTWNSGSSWNSGKTTTVRVPIALKGKVEAYARAIDNDIFRSIPQREGDIFLIIEAIEKYIEWKRANYHPNQNSRELDISTRAWDELRKFKKLLKENPQVLFEEF
ncbi:hypothetical protein BV372_08070 [Nostoc sp. T09]|uniref:hypothetical protein n=1 Tax=Nostoc sp. T09 TaxID=1932621 RepID=UPI000A38E7E4|nr:hypothetical protein [Nostoc sp. T09]OUL36364.1 hypothetical protein BV372_08070 [Nostoc sp. T09]